ncbi:DUF4959 domain-containing protein [Prolixibacteraceae bacterium JC049]|nr:DUF4959 domain-containing protein [Prolixibacteraceae bacterium JC049]
MRNKLIYLVSLLFVFSCQFDQPYEDEGSMVAPDKVNVTGVTNINGGAIITYDKLTGDDVIGVRASYQYNADDKVNEVFASAVSDTIIIKGFADTLQTNISLVAVNSNGIESEPNVVSITPKTPPVELAAASAKLIATIGGIKLQMTNLPDTYISAILEYRNDSTDWEYHDDIYRTKDSIISVKYLGITSAKQSFRVKVVDEFNNLAYSSPKDLKPTSIEDGIYDIEGNHYSIIAIGSQLWLGENLKCTKYNDGTPIANVTEDDEWNSLETAAYCWQDNNVELYKKYGALYNWFVVDPASNGGKQIAPEGTHIPTDKEWMELERALGMSEEHIPQQGWNRGTNQASQLATANAPWKGGKLKSDPALGSSGFEAYPIGRRSPFKGLERFNQCTFWWSADELGTSAWVRGMFYSNNRLNREPQDKKWGFSIRCILDD